MCKVMSVFQKKIINRQKLAGREERAIHWWARRVLERVFSALQSAQVFKQQWQERKQHRLTLANTHYKTKCFNKL